MNKFVSGLFTLIFICISINLFSVNSLESKRQQAEVLGMELYEKLNIETLDDFLNLTPRQIKKATGKRLKLKQIIGLKVVQRKMKKKMKKDPAFAAMASGDKSQLVALLLAIFVGVLGIHRFYLGYTGIGIIQLLTLGGCGIWALVDLIMIATGNLKPKDGSSYNPTI